LEIEVGTLNGGTVDTDGEPIVVSEFSAELSKDLLEEGICLSSLEAAEDSLEEAAQDVAKIIGGDFCAMVPGLAFTSDGSGGQLKVRLERITAEHIARIIMIAQILT
jgi:hypothetical protein